MSQSCFFGDKIAHAKSVGFRLYSAVWQSESRISSRYLDISLILFIYLFFNIFEEEKIS